MQHSWSGYSRRFYLGHQNDMKTLMMSFSIDYSWLNSENVIKLSALPLHFTERRLTLGVRRFHIFSDFVFVIHFSTILFIHSFIPFYVHSLSLTLLQSHFSEAPNFFIYSLFSPNLCELVFLWRWLTALSQTCVYLHYTRDVWYCFSHSFIVRSYFGSECGSKNPKRQS